MPQSQWPQAVLGVRQAPYSSDVIISSSVASLSTRFCLAQIQSLSPSARTLDTVHPGLVRWSQARHVSCIPKASPFGAQPSSHAACECAGSQPCALPGCPRVGLPVPADGQSVCLPHRHPQVIQAKLLKADLHGAVISGNSAWGAWLWGARALGQHSAVSWW